MNGTRNHLEIWENKTLSVQNLSNPKFQRFWILEIFGVLIISQLSKDLTLKHLNSKFYAKKMAYHLRFKISEIWSYTIILWMYPNDKVQILLLNTHLIDPKHTNWKHMGVALATQNTLVLLYYHFKLQTSCMFAFFLFGQWHLK